MGSMLVAASVVHDVQRGDMGNDANSGEIVSGCNGR
jgi:hypothetical protein